MMKVNCRHPFKVLTRYTDNGNTGFLWGKLPRSRCDTRTHRWRSGNTDHRTESLGGFFYMSFVTQGRDLSTISRCIIVFFLYSFYFFKFHAAGCSGNLIPRFFFGWYTANYFSVCWEIKKLWKTFQFCSDSDVMAIVFTDKKDISAHIRVDARLFRSKISISWNSQIRSEHKVNVSVLQTVQSSCQNFTYTTAKHILYSHVNLLNPTGHVMHQQYNIQQFYVLSTLYLCVLYLSESKQRLVPLTA